MERSSQLLGTLQRTPVDLQPHSVNRIKQEPTCCNVQKEKASGVFTVLENNSSTENMNLQRLNH